ncbi:MAG TPA: lipoprotein-releasing ABC transporter permease subunit [Alphaproteobacteria bacterium]|nr:lipoprotein-releasing ABC transporter permease subunit [Alphaproteobacteria bacterium]
MLAGRYLRARRQEGFVSVIAGFSLLGIALGVATLIIVMSIMGGVRDEFIGKILGINPHLTVSTYGPVEDYQALAAKLRTAPGVTGVTATVEGQVLLTLNGYATGLVVHGITHEDLAAKAAIAGHIESGTLSDFDDHGVAIGIRLAQRLRLSVGDKIDLLSPKLTQTPFGSMPRKGTFTIAMIFNAGIYDVDSSLILMPLDTAQGFFQTGEGVTQLDITIAEPERGLYAAMSSIVSMLPPQFRVTNWKQANAAYLTAVDTERGAMFLILSLIILVAAFNIISSLVMLVKDKNADIAVLRTMGATRGMIMRVFFLTGASIGVVGAFSGVVLAILFVHYIEYIRRALQAITGADPFNPEMYFLNQIPARFDWEQAAYTVAIALVISFVFSIIPAWRASRVDPVEALRYE